MLSKEKLRKILDDCTSSPGKDSPKVPVGDVVVDWYMTRDPDHTTLLYTIGHLLEKISEK